MADRPRTALAGDAGKRAPRYGRPGQGRILSVVRDDGRSGSLPAQVSVTTDRACNACR